MATLLYVPHMAARVRDNPWLFSIALANMLAIANIPREIHHGRDWRAFLSSCVAMIALMGLFGLEMYPNLVFSNPESGQQPDDLQRRLVAEDAGHHADHRGHRRAGRAGLHGEHLLDFPRQGEARQDELLIPGACRQAGTQAENGGRPREACARDERGGISVAARREGLRFFARMPSKDKQISQSWLLPLLRLRVWIFDHIRPSDLQVTLLWAGVIGFIGAAASVVFRRASQGVHWLLTHQTGGYVESFMHLSWWQRLSVPAIGGALAGLTIFFGARLSPRKSSTDYMEAIVLGDGVVPARLSFVKCVSALFSIASGGSIGREGPMVQLSAVLASLIGRVPANADHATAVAGGVRGLSRDRVGLQRADRRRNVRCGNRARIGRDGDFRAARFLLGHRHADGANISWKQSALRNSDSRDSPQFKLGNRPLRDARDDRGTCRAWFLRLLQASEKLFTKLAVPFL